MNGQFISGILLVCIIMSTMSILPGLVFGAVPTTTLSITGPIYESSLTYVNSLSRFVLTATEPGGAVSTWYRWNSYDAVEYSAPFGPSVEIQTPGAPVLPIDLEGLNTIYYNSTDSAGNHEIPKSLNVFVDDYSPNSTISFSNTVSVASQTFLNSSSRITITSTDDGSGLKDIFYIIDQNPAAAYTGPFSIDADGPHTIYYYGVDNLETKEDEKTASIFVDLTGPEARAAAGQPNVTGYVTPATSIKIDSLDSGSGTQDVYYRIDDGIWQAYSEPFHLGGEGAHAIHAYAVDRTNNVGQTSLIELIVDSTPPDVTVAGEVNGGIEVKWGDNVSFTASDSGVGNYVIFYSLDDGNTWNEYTGIRIMENAVITYYARDALGNTGSQQTLAVNVVMDSNDNMLYMKIGLAIAVVGTVLLIIINWPRRKSPEEDSEKNGNADTEKEKTWKEKLNSKI